MPRITATQAARNFSHRLNRVMYQGASFEAEVNEFWSSLPRLDPEDAASFAADLQEIRDGVTLPDPIWD